jgi:hypothetical protein
MEGDMRSTGERDKMMSGGIIGSGGQHRGLSLAAHIAATSIGGDKQRDVGMRDGRDGPVHRDRGRGEGRGRTEWDERLCVIRSEGGREIEGSGGDGGGGGGDDRRGRTDDHADGGRGMGVGSISMGISRSNGRRGQSDRGKSDDKRGGGGGGHGASGDRGGSPSGRDVQYTRDQYEHQLRSQTRTPDLRGRYGGNSSSGGGARGPPHRSGQGALHGQGGPLGGGYPPPFKVKVVPWAAATLPPSRSRWSPGRRLPSPLQGQGGPLGGGYPPPFKVKGVPWAAATLPPSTPEETTSAAATIAKIS